jgi:cholesterol transport system auxiliary component
MNPVQNKAALVATLLLAACGPLVKIGDSGPAPQRFTLSLARTDVAAVALPTLRVEDLESPAELATARMAVRMAGQEIRYVTGGIWTDRPARLLRALTADALRQRSTGIILSPAQSDIAPAHRLTGRLIAFHADASSGTANKLIVRSDYLLIATKTGTVLASQRFEAAETASSDSPADLAQAANRAANSVAAQTADWVTAMVTQTK